MPKTNGVTMGQINFLVGLDTILYKKHEDSQHRHSFHQQVNWAGEYLVHKVQDGHANAKNAKAETDTFSDQVFTSYIWFRVPAIKGVHDKSNSQAFPSDDRVHRLQVERRVAQRAAKEASAWDRFTDEEDEDERRASTSRVTEGLNAYLSKNYGQTSTRVERDVERAPTVATSTATRTASRQKYYAYLISGWSYALVPTLTCMLGNLAADTHTDNLMYIIHEVAVTESKRLGLCELTGKAPRGMTKAQERAYLVNMSSRNQQAFLPVTLWHTATTKKALHVCALDWSAPVYEMDIAPWTSVIRRATKTTKVVKADGTELTDSDLWMTVVFYHLYVDGAERDIMVEEEFDLLITKWDMRPARSNFSAINIKWGGPTTMFFWIVTRGSCKADNDHWNWWGFFDEEPVVEACINFGTQERQVKLPGMFYRLVQTFEKCIACPDACVYMYGFCFEAFNPLKISGSVNLLRYSEATLDCTLQKYLATEDTIVIEVYRCGYLLLNHSGGSVIPLR